MDTGAAVGDVERAEAVHLTGQLPVGATGSTAHTDDTDKTSHSQFMDGTPGNAM